MTRAKKFLLEGCAFDPLLDDVALREQVMKAGRLGLVSVLVTDLTHQDLMAIRDLARRRELLELVEKLSPLVVGLPAVLVDPSLKRARATYPGDVYPVDDEDVLLLRRLGVSQRADARQAVAARWADACLVTEDQTLIRRARAETICAVSSAEFAIEIRRMLGKSPGN